jgi:8-oxo-dGTP diphosphatase
MVIMLGRREFTCAVLIDTLGRFLLQQRDNVLGIVHPGKIGLFAGHRENGETYLRCIIREVHEELSYFIAPERFQYLAGYDATDVTLKATRSFMASFLLRGMCRSKKSWSQREHFSSRRSVRFRP